MQQLEFNPVGLIIIENLERTYTREVTSIDYYFEEYVKNSSFKKEIPIIKDNNNRFIILDGSKLCLAARLLKISRINCLLLENPDEGSSLKNRFPELYKSQLLDSKNYFQIKEDYKNKLDDFYCRFEEVKHYFRTYWNDIFQQYNIDLKGLIRP